MATSNKREELWNSWWKRFEPRESILKRFARWILRGELATIVKVNGRTFWAQLPDGRTIQRRFDLHFEEL